MKSTQRIAAEDVERRGKVIRKGDRLRWFMAAANRDPRAFDDPDRFDIGRQPNTARLLRRRHPLLPGRLARARRGAGGLPRARRALRGAAAGDGGARVLAERPVPLAHRRCRWPGTDGAPRHRRPRLCVGNAQCVGLAPDVFRHNENRQSEVIDPDGRPGRADPEGRELLPDRRHRGRGRRDRRAALPLRGRAGRRPPAPCLAGFFYSGQLGPGEGWSIRSGSAGVCLGTR